MEHIEDTVFDGVDLKTVTRDGFWLLENGQNKVLMKRIYNDTEEHELFVAGDNLLVIVRSSEVGNEGFVIKDFKNNPSTPILMFVSKKIQVFQADYMIQFEKHGEKYNFLLENFSIKKD